MGGIGFVFPNRSFILQDNEISTVKSEIVVGTFDNEIWVEFGSFNKNGKTHSCFKNHLLFTVNRNLLLRSDKS